MSKICLVIDAAGGITALALALGVRPPTVHQWKTGRRPVPAKHALAIARLWPVLASVHDLRPDVFGDSTRLEQPATSGITKRALMRRLALVNETGLAVVLGLPREEVEAWGDDDQVPALPQVLELLRQPEAAELPPEQADPDDSRIVPVEVA